ncbi:MAG TPA: IPT/TIG domain-containing protein [Acidimicrobiales bacterium]|nr:IPT/TIG domain-containing protein [Acidimicrobiales bacterium]
MKQRSWWRPVALVVTASFLAAACSASPSAVKHKKHPAAFPVAAPTTAPTTSPTTGTGNTGLGNTGNTGNTGTGDTGNTGNSGTGNTGTGTAPKSATPTTVVTTTTPPPALSPTGRHHRRTAPFIAKFRPVSSPSGGMVTIVGKRLAHATTVSIDGIPTAFIESGSTKINAVVPPGATSGPISVITPYGTATVQGFVVT